MISWTYGIISKFGEVNAAHDGRLTHPALCRRASWDTLISHAETGRQCGLRALPSDHMTKVRQEVLSLVLGKLVAADDIVRCAAVNKAWLVESQALRPAALALSPIGTGDKEKDSAFGQ